MKCCSVEEFKESLDLFLCEIPDEPNIQGTEYSPAACDMFTGKPSNSLIDQIRTVVEKNPQLSTFKRKPGH